MKKCSFCLSTDISLLYDNKYHKFKEDHGPISFYLCNDCSSGLTLPVPTKASLSELYRSFDGGMSGFTRSVRENNPLCVWYNQCVDRMLGFKNSVPDANSEFTWIDVGAGNGEVANILAHRFPNSNGMAIDYHEIPNNLKGVSNVKWMQVDLNDNDFSKKIPYGNFDFVLSITVLEHVSDPFVFVKNILNLKNEGGILYLTAPDMGSVAAKILGKFWPYLIFGEHLNIPSKTGMRSILSNLTNKNTNDKANIHVSPVTLPYPLTYYLDHYGLSKLSNIFSKNLLVRINTGILEAVVY